MAVYICQQPTTPFLTTCKHNIIINLLLVFYIIYLKLYFKFGRGISRKPGKKTP